MEVGVLPFNSPTDAGRVIYPVIIERSRQEIFINTVALRAAFSEEKDSFVRLSETREAPITYITMVAKVKAQNTVGDMRRKIAIAGIMKNAEVNGLLWDPFVFTTK